MTTFPLLCLPAALLQYQQLELSRWMRMFSSKARREKQWNNPPATTKAFLQQFPQLKSEETPVPGKGMYVHLFLQLFFLLQILILTLIWAKYFSFTFWYFQRLGKGKKGKSNEKQPEKAEEVIHVRARRGQATDSHSLAERVGLYTFAEKYKSISSFFFFGLRTNGNVLEIMKRSLNSNMTKFFYQVRREKINEKMRCLQDLVPGCHKVKLSQVQSCYLFEWIFT